MSPFPEPLPLRGSAPTKWVTIRRAHRPSTDDLEWAELFAVVSPNVRAQMPDSNPPPFPMPNVEEVTRLARRAGIDPWGLSCLVFGIFSSRLHGLEIRVLVVGSAALTARALELAEELAQRLPTPPAQYTADPNNN